MSALEQATAAQVAAAHPERSTWVSANAGSGKTRVLTNRVARLLLAGCPPQKILCLTYTKAAAAEMQNRLFGQLGEWAMKPDEDLRKELSALGEGGLDGSKLARARTLFARALETPGGLKIQTIHSFCGNILRRFPLEAGVPPQFQEVDDRQARQMQAEILEEIADTAPAVFDALATYASDDDLTPLLDGILKNRDIFLRPFDEAAAARALGTEPDLDDEKILSVVMQGYSDDELDELAAAMAHGGKQDVLLAEALARRGALSATDALALYETLYLTKEGAPRSARGFPVVKVVKAYPPAAGIIETIKERMLWAREQRLARYALQRAAALHGFGAVFLRAYEARKAALGRLDFDDLIARTRALLTRAEMAAWVLYRLDGGIDHILVDEAQDTSPTQWDIVRILAEEFTSGSDERATPRTVFVVGDEKQSIYSFQGADPAEFGKMRGMFAERLLQIGQELQETGLLYSFRTAAPILQLVDQVFTGDAREGLSGDIEHRAVWDMAGRVELWPFIVKPEKPEQKEWYLPVDSEVPDDPHVQLAGTIARQVAAMIREGTVLPHRDGPRPVTAGDILILVQSRNPLFHAIIKALKSEGVDVAGADRLKIVEELAVRDLLALLRFLVTPGDDLSLAAVLRSPLSGLSERDLFHLAHGRKGTLWQALRARADDWPDLVAQLENLRAMVDFRRPYDLLEHILIVQDGRRKLVARLGPEAADGIDELLNQSLHYESVEAPSLSGFLDWITADDVQVKRQMDAAGGRVRVMTVHGAKGLEAPVVILPDTRKIDASKKAAPVQVSGDLALWKPAAPEMSGKLNEVEDTRRRLVDEENRRLLYVALTRAEYWLIVCGAGTPDKSGEGWYQRVARAMESCGATPAPAPEGLEGEALVLGASWQKGTAPAAADTPARAALPAALRQPLPPPERKAQRLSPSDLQGAHTLAGGPPDAEAMTRGTLIHLLLEVLPALPETDWPARAAQLGAEDLLAEARAVLTAPDLHRFFTADALVEVLVTAPLEALGGRRILGRIDRLLVGDEILAIDFKSNREVPDSPAEVPEGILRQMGAYAGALAQIYPDRPVRTAIIWTFNAKFMEIPPDLANAALSRPVTS